MSDFRFRPVPKEDPHVKMLRLALAVACLALAAGCGSDDAPTSRLLTPGTSYHGAMTPAAPVGITEPQALVATADPGFVFAGWVATPADKAAFADAALASTTVILSGDATIAPTFMVATATLFVNPRLGADDATGTSAAQPFRTLTHAFAVAGGGAKGPAPVIAVAPGTYDAAGGETFPLVVPAGITVVGDEENKGAGIVVSGAGPMATREFFQTAMVPSSNATVAGLTVTTTGNCSLAYEAPTGGAGITLRNNTIATGGFCGVYLMVASGGMIADNLWQGGGTGMTLIAVGGDATTPVQGNVFQGPVELDNNYLDLGGGAGASTGHNQFIGAGMNFFTGLGVKARDNHWRHAPPTVSPTWAQGPSEYDMFLLGVNTTVDTAGYY